MIDEDNQYAFPGQTDRKWYLGLTKRELFAAMAMHGLLANTKVMDEVSQNMDIHREAVNQADALIEELEGEND